MRAIDPDSQWLFPKGRAPEKEKGNSKGTLLRYETTALVSAYSSANSDIIRPAKTVGQNRPPLRTLVSDFRPVDGVSGHSSLLEKDLVLYH